MQISMKEKKIRISLVGYTNTIPFLHGLKSHFTENEIEIIPDSPSQCAQKIESGESDIGLIPVAVIPHLKNCQIISNYCIGTEKKVDSVLLYSEKPLPEIKKILLDYQSRTSVELVKILCQEHWNINPHFVPASVGFETSIRNDTAGVIIGDRTFVLNNKFKFQYDLAEEWNSLTGLPFVFACWVSVNKLPEKFITKFNDALSFGVNNILQGIKEYKNNSLSEEECLFYLTERINYQLTEKKQKALERFLSKIHQKNNDAN